MKSTENRTQNTEFRIQIKDYGIENTEYGGSSSSEARRLQELNNFQHLSNSAVYEIIL